MESKTVYRRKRAGFISENWGILLGLLVLCVIISVAQPTFLTPKNLLNIFRSVSSTGIIAFGMTLCIIINGIDLSQGSVIGLSACLCALLVGDTMGLPDWVGIVSGIAVGAVVGMFNGFFLSFTSLPPFVVTLSSQLIARGFCYVVTKGKMLYCDSSFSVYGNGYLFEVIPLPVVYLLVIFVIMFILLSKTKFGRYVYAIGGNREAAKFSGINIESVTWLVYTISGALAGVCGIIACSRVAQGSPITGNGMEFDGVAACYLGGISYLGGEGKIESTLIGAIVLGVVANGMSMLLVPWYVQDIIRGAIILGAVYFDVYRKTKEANALVANRVNFLNKKEK